MGNLLSGNREQPFSDMGMSGNWELNDSNRNLFCVYSDVVAVG